MQENALIPLLVQKRMLTIKILFPLQYLGGCYCCAECDPLYSPTFTVSAEDVGRSNALYDLTPSIHLGTYHHSHTQAYGSAGRPVWHRFPDSNSNAAYQVIGGAADGSMLLAATSSKLVRSTDGGNSWAIVSLLKQ